MPSDQASTSSSIASVDSMFDSAKDSPGQTDRFLALRSLSSVITEALISAREEQDENVKTSYAWDWEMIRELIEFEDKGAFFLRP